MRMHPQYISDKGGREQVETDFDGNKDISSADTGGKWRTDKDLRGLLDLMTATWLALLLLFPQ